MGYDRPFGVLAEGSENLLSTFGNFECMGTVGLLESKNAVLVFSFPEVEDKFDIEKNLRVIAFKKQTRNQSCYFCRFYENITLYEQRAFLTYILYFTNKADLIDASSNVPLHSIRKVKKNLLEFNHHIRRFSTLPGG